MKRFLLISLDFPPEKGGVARYYDGILRHLPSLGAALTQPHPLGDEHDRNTPYRVFRRRLLLPWIWPQWLLAVVSILNVRQQWRFDHIVVGNVLPLGYPALLLRVFTGIPYDISLHGLDLLRATANPWKRFWTQLILNRSHLVMVNSDWTRSLVVSRFPQLTTRIRRMYPCPSFPEPTFNDILRFKERWNLGSSQVILSVSRLVDRKGHDVALEAFKILSQTHPDMRYVIVGDGPDRERLQYLADSLKVADRVVFTGSLPDDDVAAALHAATVFLLPTRSDGTDVEGFGLVFLEAAVAGLPVVAGEGGGVAEAVEDGKTGFVVQPRDPQAVAEAVRRLLDDQELRTRMSNTARERVAREFQWEKQLEEYRRLCLE